MEKKSTIYIDLITRYFSGEATPEEISELEAWVKADPANAATFSEYHKTWKIIENDRIESSTNLDDEWKTFIRKLDSKSENVPSTRFSFQRNQSQILYYSLRIAAIFVLILISVFFLFRNFTSPAEQRLTAGNEILEHTLPDGTVVTLNAGTTLTYPSTFNGPFRSVTLQGEAWFEVAHDKTKPFIITAGKARIRVVGTSFSVNTKTLDGTKEVILSSGIVRVYYENKPEEMALLFPGDKAEWMDDGGDIMKTSNEDVNFLAWKTKHVVLNNTTLHEAVVLLTKVYHTSIRLSDEKLGNCRITATFDRQSLESVLNVLKATLDLQVRNTRAGIEISGHGCNPGQ